MRTCRAMIVATLPLAFVLRLGRPSSPTGAIRGPPLVPGALGDSLRHLRRTSHSGYAFALRAVAGDSTNFRRIWEDAVRGNPGAPPMPQVDFERNMVIVAAMASKPSTGFAITIDSVVGRGPTVEVHVTLASPGSLCIQGPAFTNPVDIVEVSRSVGTVLFRDRHVTAECKMP